MAVFYGSIRSETILCGIVAGILVWLNHHAHVTFILIFDRASFIAVAKVRHITTDCSMLRKLNCVTNLVGQPEGINSTSFCLSRTLL